MPVMISYSNLDASIALAIRNQLVANEVPVWIDRVNIRPGEKWQASIERAIRECSHVVLLLSPNSTASAEVEAEWGLACELGTQVIPVIVGDTNVPYRLRTTQHVNYIQLGLGPTVERLLEVLPREPLGKHFLGSVRMPSPDRKLYTRIRLIDPVHPSRLLDDREIRVNALAYPSLGALLDELYSSYLGNLVPPFTYGSRWVLRTAGLMLVAPPQWYTDIGKAVRVIAPIWLREALPSDYGIVPDSTFCAVHSMKDDDLLPLEGAPLRAVSNDARAITALCRLGGKGTAALLGRAFAWRDGTTTNIQEFRYHFVACAGPELALFQRNLDNSILEYTGGVTDDEIAEHFGISSARPVNS